jgi:endonuclease YncB( thermonuclease family)
MVRNIIGFTRDLGGSNVAVNSSSGAQAIHCRTQDRCTTRLERWQCLHGETIHMISIGFWLMLILVMVSLSAGAAEIVGRADHIVDGDTFDLTTSDGIVRIRICGIDSPERRETGYLAARNTLRWQIGGRQVRCIQVGEGTVCDGRSSRANRGRVVAQCFVNNEDIAIPMIRLRMACDWPRFSGSHYHRLGISNVCVQSKK